MSNKVAPNKIVPSEKINQMEAISKKWKKSLNGNREALIGLLISSMMDLERRLTNLEKEKNTETKTD